MKPFSKDLFNKYDVAARAVMTIWLEDRGFSVKDNPEKYGVDLIAIKDGDVTWVEVEVKDSWVDEFKFKTLHLPFRKLKFATKDTVFVIFRRDFNFAFMFKGDVLADSEVIKKKTKFTKGDDEFFEIPLSRVHKYYTNNNIPEGELEKALSEERALTV
jgi:hypothetical protein